MRGLFVFLVAASLASCGGEPASISSGPAPLESGTRLSVDADSPGSLADAPVVLPCFDRGPGDYEDAVFRDEGERTYRVHVPPAYNGTSGTPVVFNFHGQGRTAEHQDEYSQFSHVADAEGFILVSPQGYRHEWNIRGVFGDDGIDDVAAVSDILDRLEVEFCIDPERVFATGLSNGAEMASQVACYLPERFAAIAPVAGILFQDCTGTPVPVLTFHGTDDYNVPYETALEDVPRWANHNGCDATPVTERFGQQVVVATYAGCTAPVVFYTLEAAGHTWPGALDGTGGVGATNHEVDASRLIWEFFRDVKQQ